ncbi:MAG: TIGR04149 family rSAM-modified RiPP [Parabacteroides sp.]|nr:TIGR04149 family rSAM-modified RiPP [Parabacteroides sp.]
MKKINLKTLETVLTSKEMKNILGGGSATCSGTISCSGTCPNANQTCVMSSNNRCACVSSRL